MVQRERGGCRGAERGAEGAGVSVQRSRGSGLDQVHHCGWYGLLSSSAYKLFDGMFARTEFLNFAKLLQGCDPQIGGHLPVTLVCQVGLVWPKSKK